MCGISITDSLLILCIRDLSNDSNGGVKAFLNRELISRIVALSIPFFRIFDSILNLGLAAVRSGGRLLKCCRIKINSFNTSTKKIKAHFKAAKEALTKDFGLLWHLLRDPKQAGCTVSKNDALPKIFQKAVAQHQLKTLSEEQLDQNWNLNEFFGHVYVINLDKDKHRLDAIAKDMHKIGGCAFERIRATYGAYDLLKDEWRRVDDNYMGLPEGEQLDRLHKGQAGVFMSHYSIIKDASEKHQQAQKRLEVAQSHLKDAANELERSSALKEVEEATKQVKQYSSILILEDDNGFGFLDKMDIKKPAVINMKGAGVTFRRVMSELPDNWDMFYFVAVDSFRWMKSIFPHHSPHLHRLNYGLLANAVAINSKAYPILLNALSKIDDPNQTFRSLDHEYALLHRSLVVVTPKRPLAYQLAGKSGISNEEGFEPWNGTWAPSRGF